MTQVAELVPTQNGTETHSALPVVVEQVQNTSMFSTKDSFEHAQRVAKVFADSDLVPQTYQKKVGNVIIAMEIANRIGASPLMVMQNLYIVHGKPAWSSQFLIATLNACGRYTSIRYEEDDQDGGRCRAHAKDRQTNEVCYGPWVSMKMAEAEGWVAKNGSKWKTMPELMRRYRAATFFTRQFAPEVSMGILTTEEAYDIPATEIKQEQAPQQSPELDRLTKLIQNAKDRKTLTKLFAEIDNFSGEEKEALQAAYLTRDEQLEAAKS